MENNQANEQLLSEIDKKYKVLYETAFSILSDTVAVDYEGKDDDVNIMLKIRSLIGQLSLYDRYCPEMLF